MRHTVLSIALLLAAPLAVAAEEEAKPPLAGKLNSDHPGYAAYEQYCAVCHGLFADGKGLVAPVLKTPPSNLRTLGVRHGTPLPKQKLVRFVDGSEPVLAHGSREMPVWGTKLYETLPNPMPDSRQRGAILTILDYLESIQEPGS
jgi:mono/diheme cytochrome c family protein